VKMNRQARLAGKDLWFSWGEMTHAAAKLMKLILRETIKLNLTNGNDGQGRAWYKTASTRKAIEQQLKVQDLKRDPFEFPVKVTLTRILGPNQRFWDADSVLRGNAKQLIDSLVAVGWFHDDSMKFITQVIGAQDATQRENGPAVLIEVFADD